MDRRYIYNEDELRFENEVKKLKLRAQFGMLLDDDPEGCPRRENEWLNHLEAYEQEYADYNRVKVYSYIGEPRGIKPAELISRYEIEKELGYLTELLACHNIEVSTICDVNEREFYRFVTEDVMRTEIPNVHGNGHVRRFVYEEYYPNDVYDVQVTIIDFFQKSFKGEWKLLEGKLAPKVQTIKRTTLRRTKVLNRLRKWLAFYEEIDLHDIRFQKIEVEGRKAVVSAYVQYDAALAVAGESHVGEWFANFQLAHDGWGYWYITGVFIPGL